MTHGAISVVRSGIMVATLGALSYTKFVPLICDTWWNVEHQIWPSDWRHVAVSH